MTDAEIVACFGLEYGPDGYPKLDTVRPEKRKTAFEHFADYCRQECCISDPEKIRALWPEHQAKVERIKYEAKQAAKEARERIRVKLAAQARAQRGG